MSRGRVRRYSVPILWNEARSEHPCTEDSLKRLLILTGTTLGSAVGWWLGADFGIMTAFIVSMIGFGAGMWGGARLAKHLGA